MTDQIEVSRLEISALGPKPDVYLPHYEREWGHTPSAGDTLRVPHYEREWGHTPDIVVEEETSLTRPSDEEHNLILLNSEKPCLELPFYKLNETPIPSESDDPTICTVEVHHQPPPGMRTRGSRRHAGHSAATLDCTANIASTSPAPRIEITGEKADIQLPVYQSPTPLESRTATVRGLDWSANIESNSPEPEAPATVSVPTVRKIDSASPDMNYSTNTGPNSPQPPPYEDTEYAMPPVVIAQKMVPLRSVSPRYTPLPHSWTPKNEEELKLDMQQDNVINRIHSMSLREEKRRSLSSNLKLKLFKRYSAPTKTEIINNLPGKSESKKRLKTRSLKSRLSIKGNGVTLSMRDVHRIYHQNNAREIEFLFSKPIIPPLAKKFIEEAQLVRTETGELAYELDEEESYLLENCDKHRYMRRSRTEPDSLELLNSTERTEFGSIIRRSGTVCLPTNYHIEDSELKELYEYFGYKRLCQLEQRHTLQNIVLEKQLPSIQEVNQLPKDECVVATPPLSTPTPTPPPSPQEQDCTPMQYQYVVPQVRVRYATAERAPRPVSRQFTADVLTPPPQTTETTVTTIRDTVSSRDTPSAMSFRAKSGVTSCSPVSSLLSSIKSVASRRRVKVELDPHSPYVQYDVDTDVAVQAVQDEVTTAINAVSRVHDYLRYKKRLKKMSQKRRINELSEVDVRRAEIVNQVYLGGKAHPNVRVYPTPPGSSLSSDTAAASTSPDESEGFDPDNDRGLMRVLDQIRSLTNANVGELKSYKKPPPEVVGVVKCVFMILGEDVKKLEQWQECVILLSKLGRRHVRKRVLRMRKDRVTEQMRTNAKNILAAWTSYDIAQRSRVCVLFFIWCKEICDLNERPQDNPLLPVVLGRFLNHRNNQSIVSRIFNDNTGDRSGRSSVASRAGVLPGEEQPRMVIAAAKAFKMKRRRPDVLPPVSHSSA